MSHIVYISGSPTPYSRTEAVLRFMSETLEKKGHTSQLITMKDIPANDLIDGNWNSDAVIRIGEQIEAADGVVIGTPVYKASYPGVFKAFIDVLPQQLLAGKTVLPFMTGGSHYHLLALEYALKPLISIVQGSPVRGIYYVDSYIDREQPEQPIVDEATYARTMQQLENFIEIIDPTCEI